MATHCKEGDKPKITITFKDRKYTFSAKYAPIEITTREVPASASNGYKEEGYYIDGGAYKLSVRDHEISYSNGYDYLVTFIPCDRTSYLLQSPCTGIIGGLAYGDSVSLAAMGCRSQFFRIDTHLNGRLTVSPSPKCPNTAEKKCSIEIKYKGITIHKSQGECPASYSIQCGRCPDGQHECQSPSYPFYCCSDCSQTAKKINNLAGKYT
ncbi:hypothetical protein Cylst_2574 [Cylindrospermum stagnale PCC 7417]|uniref:Uncharacterized protein n=1 Tax=Cylindrospermum stagnale PCC 7417 TaxID=56107 RepID=K9WWM1_9NOST|nr:hypothetical protein Cylst_2574 [Cylindrospermum stagnale PCC 7417]